MTKLPHQISTDDLLNALNEAEDIESTEWTNDVPHFLSHFKMEQGQYKVPTHLLYSLYKLYSKQPVDQRSFTFTISQFLVRDGSRNPYYLVNIKPMRIAKVVNTKLKETQFNVTANLALKKHYDLFLKECKVRKGRTWVEALIFYEIYRHYCIDKRIKVRFNNHTFIKISRLYFKTRRIGHSRSTWFNVDNEIVSRFLTEDMIKRVNERRRVWSERTKEKHRQIQRKKHDEKTNEETENN